MPKKILLIESDAAFAREMTDALEGKGFQVRASGDGTEGLALAREMVPDAIVLCVELPATSGYAICNKLKKEPALKATPVVIISAEATPETFEAHKKLRNRAEDYLIKPFSGDTLLEHLRSLLGTAGGDEEVVTLADVELEALGTLDAVPAPALEEVVEEPPTAKFGAPALPAEDEDLKLLDDAFDSIAAEPSRKEQRRAEHPVAGEEIAAAAASLPEAPGAAARADLDAIGDEADAALEALSAGDDEPVSAAGGPGEPTTGPRAASADLLRAAGIPVLEPEPVGRPAPGAAREGSRSSRDAPETRGEEALRRELEEARAAATRAERELAQRDGDLRLQKTKIDGMSATVKRLEVDLKNAREETRRAVEKAAAADRELSELRARLEGAERSAAAKSAEAAEAAGRLTGLEREMEELKTELLVARGEAEGVRTDVDGRTADLRKRVQELESANAKHEERVLKAYQKIKSDEKLREKTRKALSIALQLLDERGSAEPGEKEGRPAARE